MQARQLPARSGLDWLRAAYALYRRNPPLLTSVTMLYLLVVIGLNFLPFIGAFIVPMLLPTLNLIVGNTCRVIEGGQTPDKPALLLGVREHKPQLLRLGGLQLAGSVLLLLLSMLLEGGVLPLPDADKPDIEGFIGLLLRLAVLAVPLMMAFWFAPLLTGWHGVQAGKSVFFSFVASWRNWRVFGVYVLCAGLIAVFIPGLLLVLTSLLLPDAGGSVSFVLRLLLIMVLTPVLMASAYVSYRDVFRVHEANA